MKMYKKLIWITFFTSIISFAVALALQCISSDVFCFYIDVLIGVFSSSLLLLTSSVVGYNIEKDQFILELKAKANSLRLMMKKTTTAHTKKDKVGNNICTITVDELFKKDLFEIMPYSIGIIEYLNKWPKLMKTDKIDIEALEKTCKDINTLAELICEMQVDKSIRLPAQRIESVFDLSSLNHILKINDKTSKREYISWTV